jgi:hypothetical protein
LRGMDMTRIRIGAKIRSCIVDFKSVKNLSSSFARA